MPKKKPGVQPAAAIAVPEPAESSPEASRLPWMVSFCVLSALLTALIWWPVARIPAQFTETINEGFSVYFQDIAAHGGRIYGAPPQYFWATYPPVSYHLVGWLGLVLHDINVAGRIVAFLSYLAIGMLAALIVRQLTGEWRYGALAAFCWLIWLAALDPVRVQLNDPHMLGVALGFTGLYCFLRDPESDRWLRISGVVFAVSLFTKHSLIAIPLVVGLHLLLTSRRRLLNWMLPAAATCVVLLVLTIVVDGPYFIDHLSHGPSGRPQQHHDQRAHPLLPGAGPSAQRVVSERPIRTQSR